MSNHHELIAQLGLANAAFVVCRRLVVCKADV
jgi:hypothetical protein